MLSDMLTPAELGASEFYAFTLTAEERGEVNFSVHSHWVGYADDEMRVEVREASLVSQRLAEAWRAMGQPVYFVKTFDQLTAFFLLGGNALIDRAVAEDVVPHLLRPEPTCQTGEMGFTARPLIDAAAFKRAPTPKLRMSVLRRDGRRCRICGRSPDDNTDLVLHVHHIRPWERLGLTTISNLITLCHTCHVGLDPHYDHSLFGYLREKNNLGGRGFLARVANYRRTIFDSLNGSTSPAA